MKIINFEDKFECENYDKHINKCKLSFIQQSTKWGKIVNGISGDIPKFFYAEYAEGLITCSMYLYKGEYGNIMVSNIQAGNIGCISYQGESGGKESAYRKMIESVVDEARNCNCMLVTITSNPFDDDLDLIKRYLDPSMGMKSFVSSIYLDDYFDEDGNVTYRDYNRRSNLSRNIKKSYRNNFEFYSSNNVEDMLYWYNNIHCKRLCELGGQPLPVDIFMNVLSAKGFKDNYRMFYVKHSGKIVGGDLCVFNEKGIFENFMMSTDSELHDTGLNYFLTDNLLKWCWSNDMIIYDWQSTWPPNGGIFRFKKQWGSISYDYSYCCRILDSEKVSRLSNMSHSCVNASYKGHFVVPYQFLTTREAKFYDKE